MLPIEEQARGRHGPPVEASEDVHGIGDGRGVGVVVVDLLVLVDELLVDEDGAADGQRLLHLSSGVVTTTTRKPGCTRTSNSSARL